MIQPLGTQAFSEGKPFEHFFHGVLTFMSVLLRLQHGQAFMTLSLRTEGHTILTEKEVCRFPTSLRFRSCADDFQSMSYPTTR